MITGELKNKIDAMWDVFAAGGLVNPLEVIEQVTYLMFIHDLDDADNIRAKESAMLGLPYKSIFSKKRITLRLRQGEIRFTLKGRLGAQVGGGKGIARGFIIGAAAVEQCCGNGRKHKDCQDEQILALILLGSGFICHNESPN